MKRTFDICARFLGLVILSPLFLIIAIAIKIDSKGPAFSAGADRKGKVFKIFKFRTMIVNAESIGEGLICRDDCDSRITRIGKLLTKISSDKLLQLINALIGEKDIIGTTKKSLYFQGLSRLEAVLL